MTSEEMVLHDEIDYSHAKIQHLEARIKECDTWQPIETAEKINGAKILCYGEGYVFEAECEVDDGYGIWCSIGGATPTHWMPLPNSPLQAASERGVNE